MNVFTQKLSYGDGKDITIETGKLARQAHGSVVVSQGKLKLLATIVSNKDARDGVDFLPMSVDYQEKFAAGGRIPGGFLRREGRLSNAEILVCRIVDRTLRPLFPSDYHSETQVMIQLISADSEVMPDALVGLAASAALTITDIPFEGPVSALRVGRINGEWLINPYASQMADSDVDLMVAGTAADINMVEGEMNGISEKEMVEALKFAHTHIKNDCAAQLALCDQMGGRKTPREYNHETNSDELKKQVMDATYQKYYDAAKTPSVKEERAEKFKAIDNEYVDSLPEDTDDTKMTMIKRYLGKSKKEAVRNMMLDNKQRLDGRALNEVRQIWTEVDYLPSVHGSALFTRGETQSLTSVTLGSKLDQQMIDNYQEKSFSKFMLHYNFPSFSVGEARPNRGPGRREIGHGNLAERGLKRMIPDDFPYTLRIVSDILESNGSSSMATVCAGSMAMMDAGIQVKAGVSGIAMGMVADDKGRYAILSDILGDEDHLGDMDFKVVGNEDGIYACQMDMKVDGLSYDVLEEALMQAKEGRMHILNEMEKTISKPNKGLKDHAPQIEVMTIPKDKIGAVIGSGGKVIQEIQQETDAIVTIEEDGDFGIVEISGVGSGPIEAAKEWILGIITDPEVGTEYVGKIKSIVDFGAFVEILPGKEGLLHISEISWERLESMADVFEEGEEVKVKLIEFDERNGKLRLSRKVLLEKPEGYVERPPRERRDNNRNGGDRRGGRDNRGRDNRGRNNRK
ncbi:MAG: polyribonucleotide nucleotidyltransferase [Bacteroidia bacterium]|jgi:polyribonucleotide nucleotidyltransferase|nr:polyribonucleotide nucleotidyltransferase [Bacteroidia bacterium]MDG2042506.1 polyribonucleotide nucleotidyltransferase [Bacteroidia bacterium]|tara:strand:+ start:9844 stop:12069 length:2226 start_codon:yes stop_codon:yes gene_type:complete